MNIIITLKTGVRMAGPGALSWLAEQIGYRPEEVLPAVVDLTEKGETEANASNLQWAPSN